MDTYSDLLTLLQDQSPVVSLHDARRLKDLVVLLEQSQRERRRLVSSQVRATSSLLDRPIMSFIPGKLSCAPMVSRASAASLC